MSTKFQLNKERKAEYKSTSLPHSNSHQLNFLVLFFFYLNNGLYKRESVRHPGHKKAQTGKGGLKSGHVAFDEK